MSLRNQRPGADAETTAAQAPAPQPGSPAKPGPMAPPAPGRDANSASCDVTGISHRPAGGGNRKSAALGGLSSTAPSAAPLLRKWNDLGGERGRQVEGGPRTMAAVQSIEMHYMNVPVERAQEGEQAEEQTEEQTGEPGDGSHPPNSSKVHRLILKWMLPEPIRTAYLERANCLPPPVFIISISLAQLAMFIYYAVWKPPKQWITLDAGILVSPFSYRPDKREETWRFVSYMLVHAGVQHIVANLFMQLLLGIPLEMVYKGFRVGLVYLAGVMAGSLATSIFDPLNYQVGASGGVYALMGGCIMHFLLNFREMVRAFGVVRLLIIVLIIASDLGFAFYRNFFVPENGFPVSFVAHFAGLIAGTSLGYSVFIFFDKALLKEPLFWIAVNTYISFILFTVYFNFRLSPGQPASPPPPAAVGGLVPPPLLLQPPGTPPRTSAGPSPSAAQPSSCPQRNELVHRPPPPSSSRAPPRPPLQEQPSGRPAEAHGRAPSTAHARGSRSAASCSAGPHRSAPARIYHY
ncbi:rhomboid-related protein 2 [Octodon degus]|uniref:Rhomboid-related protein 2 n=1 Tax=Octodon degus TaxID=10160 RepID=A0A6P6DAA2_OCTDE|nr:rhomboid-related protein 2 [Octodon degus]